MLKEYLPKVIIMVWHFFNKFFIASSMSSSVSIGFSLPNIICASDSFTQSISVNSKILKK